MLNFVVNSERTEFLCVQCSDGDPSVSKTLQLAGKILPN